VSGVDAVILATTTADRLVPTTAPEVATRLGLTGIPAFDLGAVCGGFVYGLATAAGLLAVGQANTVLLIGADSFSTVVDPKDRTTAVIFGDGAGAVVLRAGSDAEPGAVGPYDLGSDGTLQDLGLVPAGGSRQRSGEAPEDHYFRMRGNDMYRHAVEHMTASASRALDRAGWTVADVDRFAPHQANARIAAAVADRLGLPAERQLSNIDQVGNTVAASIPLLLAHAHSDGRLRPGHRVLIAAFGAGAVWGATTLIWPALHENGD
jgi:3-oxoacyl-[acyl-carrier-protein] synthase-3